MTRKNAIIFLTPEGGSFRVSRFVFGVSRHFVFLIYERWRPHKMSVKFYLKQWLRISLYKYCFAAWSVYLSQTKPLTLYQDFYRLFFFRTMLEIYILLIFKMYSLSISSRGTKKSQFRSYRRRKAKNAPKLKKSQQTALSRKKASLHPPRRRKASFTRLRRKKASLRRPRAKNYNKRHFAREKKSKSLS